MAQDIRELFRKEPKTKGQKLKSGHEKRFLKRLENELPKRKRPFSIVLRVAASVLVLLGLAGYFLLNGQDPEAVKTKIVGKDMDNDDERGISLGDLSPDLKKIENYYVANINLELSRLKVSKKNRGLVDSFMDQLAELNGEYTKLNTELNKMGPNEQTITAMIKNLQLRLQLMHKLKEKLNQLKSSKNETVEEKSI